MFIEEVSSRETTDTCSYHSDLHVLEFSTARK